MVTVILDNDECTGSYALGATTYLYLKSENVPLSPKTFSEQYLAIGGARPGTLQLLQMLYKYKHYNTNHKLSVIMFTAAENVNGWVDFLKQALEIYAKTPGLFDDVLTRKDCTYYNGRFFKDLNKTPFGYRIMIEDTPENVLNHDLIYQVDRYVFPVDISSLVSRLPSSYSTDIFIKQSFKHLNFEESSDLYSIVNSLSSVLTSLLLKDNVY